MRHIFDRSNATTPASLLIASVLATFFAAGCSDILKVELPGRIPTDLLGDPITAPTLAASVVADFECAFSNYVASTSILSDQFLGASGNLSAKNWGTKKINEDDTSNEQTSCAGSLGAYTPLQTARFQADDILARLQGWTDAQSPVPLAPLRARVAAFGAYAFQGAWGSQGSGQGQFGGVLYLAVGPDGSVYVVDDAGSRVEKFTADGAFVTTWGARE